MQSFGIWWASLGLVGQIYWGVALLSTSFLLLQLGMNLLGLSFSDADVDAMGGDMGGDVDAPDGDMPGDIDHPELGEHSTGLGVLSLRTITAFLVGFGWGGVAMGQGGHGFAFSLLVAVGCGLFFMFTVFWLMNFIFKLSETGNVDISNALNQTGSVYIPIPPAGEGSGQVQVTVQGRLIELDARNQGSEHLHTGSPIQVTKVLSDHSVVVKLIQDS